MLQKLLARGSNRDAVGSPHPGLVGLELASVRDARGFDLGVISAARGAVVTVAVELQRREVVEDRALSAWRSAVSADETVVATCVATSVAAGGLHTRLWVSLAAGSKEERKDREVLLTRVAMWMPVVYDSADAVGLEALPLTPDEMQAYAEQALTDGNQAGESVFPPLVTEVAIHPGVVEAAGMATVSFVVHLDEHTDDLVAVLVSLCQQLSTQMQVTARVGWWSRIPTRAQHPARQVAVFSLCATEIDLVEQAAQILIAQLPALFRLRLRRLWHRQPLGAAMSAGLGMLGWQRLEVS